MRMVIDEWLWEDLTGSNGEARQAQTFRFLRQIHGKCDQLVCVKGSRFDEKAWSLLGRTDAELRSIARFYSYYFRLNSKKQHMVDFEALPPPHPRLEELVKDDDRYLARSVAVEGVDLLVTTDQALRDAVLELGYQAALRDPFLQDYMQANAEYAP